MLGRTIPVSSGFRSRADQERLYRNRASNPYPVAKPGGSEHEDGDAIDVPISFVPQLLSVSAKAGLTHPFPRTDPVHFEWTGARANKTAPAGSTSSGGGLGVDDIPVVGPVLSGASAVVDFFGALMKRETWVRVLEVAGGLGLGVLGFVLLTRSVKV